MEYLSLEILDSMDAGFALYEMVLDEAGNQDMKFLYANEHYATRVRGTSESVRGQLFSKLVPNDVAWIPKFAEVAFWERKTYAFESYSAEANYYVHTQLFSAKYGQVAIIVHDRSEFVKDEMTKEREELDTRLMIATLPDGICYGETIRNEAGEIVNVKCTIVNEAFEMFMGVRVGSLQGESFEKIYHDKVKADLKQIDKAMNKNDVVTFVRAGVEGRIVEISIYPQSENQLIILVRNVTKRVNDEKALAQAHKTIVSGMNYANKIQRNMLPGVAVLEEAFTDYSVIWEPRDVVGGDSFWVKNFEKGSVLSVCDCTGHGTSGALLTMLVVSTLDDCVDENNCEDTASTVWSVEQKLVSVFNRKQNDESCENIDGCDLAVLFIAKDGSVSISSARLHVYICDGEKVVRLKGQRIFIGEGKLLNKSEIETIHIPANENQKFYIATDGLSDQPGGSFSRPYGYKEIEKIILEHHKEEQSFVSQKIWDAFEAWRGTEARVDDFELISFKV